VESLPERASGRGLMIKARQELRGLTDLPENQVAGKRGKGRARG